MRVSSSVQLVLGRACLLCLCSQQQAALPAEDSLRTCSCSRILQAALSCPTCLLATAMYRMRAGDALGLVVLKGAMEGGRSAALHCPQLIHSRLDQVLVMAHHQHAALEQVEPLQQQTSSTNEGQSPKLHHAGRTSIAALHSPQLIHDGLNSVLVVADCEHAALE